MRVHHIGYLVKRIERAISDFQKLGFNLERLSNDAEDIVIDNIRKIKVVFMVNDSYRIELVQPLGEESPIYGLLRKYRNSPYHVCYSTACLGKEVEILRKAGWSQIKAPEIAPALNNCQVVFMVGANSGMLELVEDERNGN